MLFRSINVDKVQETPGETETLTVSLNMNSTKSLISGFIEAYNAFTQVTKQLGAADSDKPGLLVGDYTLRQSSSQIRNLFSSTVSSVTGDFNSLSSIGISTKQDGTLEIDNDILDSAISTDFDQFENLFASDDGFATQLRDLVSNYTGSSGIITTRENSLNSQLDRIEDDQIGRASCRERVLRLV